MSREYTEMSGQAESSIMRGQFTPCPAKGMAVIAQAPGASYSAIDGLPAAGLLLRRPGGPRAS
jgi:hypothetical protein